MDESVSRDSEAAPVLSLKDRAGGIIATGTILALLYFGRDVLVPITLALILSLLLAPLVRRLRRQGVGPTLSVLLAVLTLALTFGTVAAVIGVQLVRMAASLPQYEETIQYKIATLNDLTVGRLNAFNGQAGRIISERSARPDDTPVAALQPAAPGPVAPIPVEIHDPPTNPLQVIQRVLGSVWVPLETAGIVLVVLIFVLLEHETLRDRFIRIAGGTDIRGTTLALNDAGERLSRFFVSQFAVNLGVGGAIAVGLAIIGLPHALLWAALAAVLRFVPYVGVWIAALFAAVLGGGG